MAKRHYIIYCDESDRKGRLFSNFFGGVILKSSDQQIIQALLNQKKADLNLHSEIKWQKISANYLEKYKEFISYYFSFIAAGRLKIRIMFSQNLHRPLNLTSKQKDDTYFHLYYQFLKHAFGIAHCNPDALDRVYFTILLDQIPGTKEKANLFKGFLSNIPNTPEFYGSNLFIPRSRIADVESKDHVILQGMDIILGAVCSKLNKKLEEKLQGSSRRGKRTIAKEKLYKHINAEIRQIYPGFNVGASTGTPNGLSDRWKQHYRHWRFIPKQWEVNPDYGK